MKANDFTDFANYFLKCSLLRHLSMTRDAQGSIPESILKFLWFVDFQSHNTGNCFDDFRYRCTLMETWGNVQISSNFPLFSEWSIKIIARLVHVYEFDQIVTSPNFCVSAAALHALCQWKSRHPQLILADNPVHDLFALLHLSNKSVLLQYTVWKWCLLNLEQDYELYLPRLCEALTNMNEEVFVKCITVWLEAYEQSILDLGVARENTETNRKFMDVMWNLLWQETPGTTTEQLLKRFYQLLWGGNNFSSFLTKRMFLQISALQTRLNILE
jgi:hypothetical protein